MTAQQGSPTVLVLGAGVAGLTAAYELAQRGFGVTVLEAAAFAGGRSAAFCDGRGRSVDTGLHVVADHYVNLIEILARLGVSKHLCWVEKHTYLRRGRPPMQWHFTPLRPPFHLLRPWREMPLGLGARVSLATTGIALASYSQEDLALLDDVTYLEWHERRRLGQGFALELAEAAADAATFLTIGEAAARPVLSWIKYLMRHRRAGDVGLWHGSFEDCLVAPLRSAIETHGGRVRTGVAVLGLELSGRRVTGVRCARSAVTGICQNSDGAVAIERGTEELLLADYVISALPVQAFRRSLSPAALRDLGLHGVTGLTTTPAISVLVWFDRKIEPPPSGAPLVTGCAMRDFVDLESLGRRPKDAPGSVYQFVVTRARERMADSDEQIVADVIADLRSVWPGARNAHSIDYAVERIPAAMFAALPGAHRLRPKAEVPGSNLVLAGDWTSHELNASLEGAALSGRLAANVVLQALGAAPVVVRRAPDPSVVPALRRVAQPLRRARLGVWP